MFKKILIANRGEIAVRVIRTCKEMGISTVAVHSSADSESLHVKYADESVCIGPPSPKESYLCESAVLSAVEISGADGVHPGYGFLSENADFSRNCENWGVKFIGPSPDIVTTMGSKIESKKIAEKAGVPTLKSILVDFDSKEETLNKLSGLFPVLIKASAGGGGRGMSIVESEARFWEVANRLRQEASLAFNDGTLFVEKYIERPRHIEVQVLGDGKGNFVHLGERDCSIQRRYQKIIEESPSPVLTSELREKICEAAIKLCKSVNYDSVGTVEFLYDLDSEQFFFIEMNTRIQVEHTVTEERTGIDLIQKQIEIAAGQPLLLKQEDVTLSGHAIECRLTAEDPKTGQPRPGLLEHYHRPSGAGVRVDDFVYSGYQVTPHYDSLLAKLICRAENRELCIERTKRALDEFLIGGASTNLEMLKKTISDPRFRSSQFSVGLLT